MLLLFSIKNKVVELSRILMNVSVMLETRTANFVNILIKKKYFIKNLVAEIQI